MFVVGCKLCLLRTYKLLRQTAPHQIKNAIEEKTLPLGMAIRNGRKCLIGAC
jgi:hypothetical protein